MRMLLLSLAVIAGIVIGIVAIFSAISTKADERKLPIYSVDRADQKVALTFNCAWGNSNTDELLNILDKENIKSTFFVTGEFCDKYPEDVLKIFKAGHEIQNHSDKHPHVEGANINDFILDAKQAEQKILRITGVKPTLYRAPYGEFDNNSIFSVTGMGYKYIQWSVDSIDWQEPDAKTIVNRVVKGTKAGSIVLFHNDLANTTEALPQIISKLKDKGCEFTTVTDLIYHEGYKIDHTGKQYFDGSADSQLHTAGTQVNAAFEILLTHLTIDEIMSLENGLSPELTKKLTGILTKEQINAVSALSDEELQSAWSSLVEAKITGMLSDEDYTPVGGVLEDVKKVIDNGKFTYEDVAGVNNEVFTTFVTPPATAPVIGATAPATSAASATSVNTATYTATGTVEPPLFDDMKH
ncbi:MAG: polysaccharide deacetylase family protein [Oscillospiraceae bacterium]|nr:polysaccharide deacetylase family protein [Oscillospiraceae bacterium]